MTQTVRMFQTPAVSPTLVLLFALGLRAEESPRRITALAGEYDRHDSIVWFTLPKGATQLQYLEDERGERLVFQTDDPGQACYLEKDLKRGSQKTYRMVAAASSSVARGVEVARKNRQIELAIGGQVALCYQAEPGELPRPDIAPIYKR